MLIVMPLVSIKRATTAASLAGGTTITMVGDFHRYIEHVGFEHVTDMQWLPTARVFNIHVEHLIKITVVNVTLPIDAELIDTHEVL